MVGPARGRNCEPDANNNNVFISRNIKFTVLCPANSYNANLGGTRLK